MKLGVNKIKKWQGWNFEKNLSRKRYYDFFCMMIEADTVRLLAQVPGFQNNNPGIRRGLMGGGLFMGGAPPPYEPFLFLTSFFKIRKRFFVSVVKIITVIPSFTDVAFLWRHLPTAYYKRYGLKNSLFVNEKD